MGGEFTAEDIAWSFNAGNPILTPEAVHDTLPNPGVGKLDAIGKYTVRINWTPFPLNGIWQSGDSGEGIGAFPKRAESEEGAEWMKENVIGTGPFEMVEWIAQQHVVVRARPDIENIWQKVPFVARVRWLDVPETFTRRALMETGEVQIAEIELKDWPDMFAAGFKLADEPESQTVNIFWHGNYWETVHPKTGGPDGARAGHVQALDLRDGRCRLQCEGFQVPPGSEFCRR